MYTCLILTCSRFLRRLRREMFGPHVNRYPFNGNGSHRCTNTKFDSLHPRHHIGYVKKIITIYNCGWYLSVNIIITYHSQLHWRSQKICMEWRGYVPLKTSIKLSFIYTFCKIIFFNIIAIRNTLAREPSYLRHWSIDITNVGR